MRSFDAETAAYLAEGHIVARLLFWITARRKSDDVAETLGFWSGEYDASITIGGSARAYAGVSTSLTTEAFTWAPGLGVNSHQIKVDRVNPDLENLLMAYDLRFAPVELHRAFLDPETRAIVGTPERMFKGIVNSAPIERGLPGATPQSVISLVSEARGLTRALSTMKSDESHKDRGGDRFRRYSDVSAVIGG